MKVFVLFSFLSTFLFLKWREETDQFMTSFKLYVNQTKENKITKSRCSEKVDFAESYFVIKT